ncbi:transcriptional attenuator, LytR family [Clostridium aceticum]|uniref:Transcriptional attenuator, LytR family n=1 Tax=Clostridium aceticum TaxID=84022 RepID=A0A0G3W9T4_9CLOT|nr:LCP family protein [Clostridium aceticum]AKL95113.1 transcriptional attenuator, LytR family [Clostridium aceticum]
MGRRTKQKKRPVGFILVLVVVVVAGIFFINNKSSHRINILVLGVDALNLQKSQATRADTIMLLSTEGDGSNPVLISIPRDTRVNIPGRRSPEKINHAHAYGGVELLTNTVEGFLDIPIHYYVRVNYKAVEELVEALGGVTVDVPIDMKYSDPYDDPPLHIDIKKGQQVLGGKDALHFLRFRSGYANQDLGRIQAQQKFVHALMDKMMSPMTIFKVPTLTKTFYNNVDTNIPKNKMLSLGIKGLRAKFQEITKLTLPGSTAMVNGISYYIVKDQDIQTIKESHLTASSELKSNSVIEVLNGCGVSGVAAEFAKKLERESITVATIGNYETNDMSESFIEYHPKHKKEARKVGKALGIKKLIEVKEEMTTVDISVVVGKDLVEN